MKFLAWLVLCSAPLFAGEAYVQLILDASGSMYNKLDDGRFRIVAAKDVLSTFVEALPEDQLNVGLRVYGSKMKASESGSCQDTALLAPMQGVNKQALLSVIKKTRALGSTPIALSIQQAGDDFPADASKRLIVLVTDGKESCGGDLKAVAADLKARGIDIDLRIIGFDLSDQDAKSFAGVGSFENAADARALAAALGRAIKDVTPPLGEASLEAPEEIPAGKSFHVKWTGEGGKSDYITLVKKGTPDGKYQIWEWTKTNPITLPAPIEAGDYELRYQSDRVPGIAARRPIKIIPAAIAVSAPARAPMGTQIQVSWVGPDGYGDYVTVVPKDASASTYASYEYTKKGRSFKLQLPLKPGDYEVRYLSEREEGIFASTPVIVEPIDILVQAPESVKKGASFEVTWQGPGGYGDYITIVPAGAAPGAYLDYKYTRSGDTFNLKAPDQPGNYEVRYQSEREDGIFATTPIKVIE